MAAYAAIERKWKRRLDEETMTRYSEADLEKGWEFKIIRFATGAFKNPQVFQATVQQESLAAGNCWRNSMMSGCAYAGL